MTLHLAEINIGRLLYPQDDPRVAEFMDNLAAINALAERSPGFVWRYSDESGNATDTFLFEDTNILVNASVWESADALADFVFKTAHARFYRKRAAWFDHGFGPALALFWIEAGTIPTIEEMVSRWRGLRENGPGADAFGWDGVAGAEKWRALRCA